MYIGLTKPHLDDSHSESSGEVTTSDSGRGGSEEDIRSNMTTSHDTGLCNGKLNYCFMSQLTCYGHARQNEDTFLINSLPFFF